MNISTAIHCNVISEWEDSWRKLVTVTTRKVYTFYCIYRLYLSMRKNNITDWFKSILVHGRFQVIKVNPFGCIQYMVKVNICRFQVNIKIVRIHRVSNLAHPFSCCCYSYFCCCWVFVIVLSVKVVMVIFKFSSILSFSNLFLNLLTFFVVQ